jgi:hypothetical protein
VWPFGAPDGDLNAVKMPRLHRSSELLDREAEIQISHPLILDFRGRRQG